MSAGIWFWIIFVLVILFGCFAYYPFAGDSRRGAGVSLAILVLIGLLGWGIFGPPIR